MRNCPNCGNAVQDGCLFCTHCGEKLEERPVGEGMPVQEAVGGEAPVQNSVQEVQAASSGAASQETKEKKGGKPYFLIGVAAVFIAVLVGVLVLGKTVLSMGLFLSPKQKFLKYQADYFNEKLNYLDKLEIFPLTKKNITFTISGEVRGNKEVAKYLEDSSIVMKTKTNPEKGSYQASLLFNLMGEDVLDAYGEYADGKLGLAFPSLEKKFYQGELQSILSNSYDEEIELPNFNKKKENRKLAEKLFKKYGSLLAEYFTEENFTVEKGSFTMPAYRFSTIEEKEFKGTVYTFQPSAEDMENFLEKFADKLEKDEDCAKFLIQSGIGSVILDHIYYENVFFTESNLSDYADWLRENAEEIAEELEEKHALAARYYEDVMRDAMRRCILDEGIQVRVIIYRPTDDAHPTRDRRAAQSSQHVDVPQELSATESQVYSALAQKPATVADLVEDTQLTARQVRYALPKLVKRGMAEQRAHSGHRGSVYHLITV